MIPEGDIAATPREAREITDKLRKPVVIKSQIEIAGRFKAGGIKFANNADEAERATEELLIKKIKELKVEKVLVEEKLPITREFYAGIIVNFNFLA